MANHVPSFFYAPTWDIPPEGPIKLGNVIGSLKTPELPLHTAQLPTNEEVYSTEKREIEFSYERMLEAKFSIVTKFMSVFGVGVDMGSSRGKSRTEILAFEKIVTTQFFPREEYLQRCIEAEAVRGFLEKLRYRKPIYIITGLKTVTGARARTLQSSSFGGNLEVEVDGTIWSGGVASIGGGPGISGNISNQDQVSWEGSSDFVLAYRVRKVRVSKAGSVKRDEDYKTGAMLGDGVGDIGAPKLNIVSEELDLGIESGSFVVEETTEGDVSVMCAVPIDHDSERGHS